ncbi:putative tail fiber protein [Escherichia phage Pondi]|nr:putative tail fiber protein [Escherichia phage Pondi]
MELTVAGGYFIPGKTPQVINKVNELIALGYVPYGTPTYNEASGWVSQLMVLGYGGSATDYTLTTGYLDKTPYFPKKPPVNGNWVLLGSLLARSNNFYVHAWLDGVAAGPAIDLANTVGSLPLDSRVSGVLPIANGGTGADNAVDARTNLNAASLSFNTFTNTQTISTSYPGLWLDHTPFNISDIGRRALIESNGEALWFFFANGTDNTARRTISLTKPSRTGTAYIGLNGGLAYDGNSVPTANATDFNTVPQGWQQIGGTVANPPVSGTSYGSVFTQCTQGVGRGNAKATGVSGEWFQQRFFDTSNRIFTRIQTNNQSWGTWLQITTSAPSDSRLKTVGSDLDLDIALANVNAMEFKNFTFNDDEDVTPRRGVISQQIKDIDPQYVKEVGGYYHLDQTPMLLDALAAIKRLTQRVAELEEKLK